MVKHFEDAAGTLADEAHEALMGPIDDVIHNAAKLIPSDLTDVAEEIFENAKEDFEGTLETEISHAIRIALERGISRYCDHELK